MEILSLSTSVFARAIGLVALLPMGETILTGFSVRFLLALVLSAITLYAHNEGSSSTLHTQSFLMEFLYGAALGVPLALTINAAGMFGELLDQLRGFNIAASYDPLHSTQTSSLELLCREFFWIMLVLQGVFPWTVKILIESFEAYPTIQLDAVFLREGIVAVLSSVIATFSLMALIAAPFALSSLFIDFVFGMLTTLIPGSSLNAESIQIKSVVTVLVWLSLLQYADPLSFFGAIGETALREIGK